CRAASLDCAKHRIVPSYDIRHLEKCCGAEGDCASNINLVEEPPQLCIGVTNDSGLCPVKLGARCKVHQYILI
ncbi:MAG: hypothetical protein IKI41_00675, partial [Clostridia bacterium]|nr:hypothetical protein [Clostridia bacterium]